MKLEKDTAEIAVSLRNGVRKADEEIVRSLRDLGLQQCEGCELQYETFAAVAGQLLTALARRRIHRLGMKHLNEGTLDTFMDRRAVIMRAKKERAMDHRTPQVSGAAVERGVLLSECEADTELLRTVAGSI